MRAERLKLAQVTALKEAPKPTAAKEAKAESKPQHNETKM